MTVATRRKDNHGWARRPERGSPFLIQFIAWVAQRIGRRAARVLLHPIALYFLIFAQETCRFSRAYLSLALGHKARTTDVYRHLHRFASTLLDRVYFLTDQSHRFAISFDGLDEIETAIGRGRGAILLGAHFGSFDAMRALADTHGDLALKVLMHEGPDGRVGAALHRVNPKLVESVIPLGRPDSMLRVGEWLRDGGAIGILGDRVPDGDKTRRVRFLGRDAAFPTSPWLLAAVTGAPVVMFAGVYLGGNRYKIRFKLLADKVRRVRGRPADGYEREMAAFVSTLEEWVREDPLNWFNFYDFWS